MLACEGLLAGAVSVRHLGVDEDFFMQGDVFECGIRGGLLFVRDRRDPIRPALVAICCYCVQVQFFRRSFGCSLLGGGVQFWRWDVVEHWIIPYRGREVGVVNVYVMEIFRVVGEGSTVFVSRVHP